MRESSGHEVWRQLEVGDQVRVVDWPPELSRASMHAETVALYELLIASSIPLTVCEIDDSGFPTGKTEISDERGVRSEYLLLNHGGIQMVRTDQSGHGSVLDIPPDAPE